MCWPWEKVDVVRCFYELKLVPVKYCTLYAGVYTCIYKQCNIEVG